MDITYGYDHEGLLTHRSITCPGGDLGCEAGEAAYVWHGQRLLETYDLAGNTLMTRYYYADGQDHPFAADLRQADGTLARFYLLPATLGSVVLGTDANGDPVERDNNLVNKDLAEDRISKKTAEEIYGLR